MTQIDHWNSTVKVKLTNEVTRYKNLYRRSSGLLMKSCNISWIWQVGKQHASSS